MKKRCKHCEQWVERKKGESYAYFEARKFCDKTCYWAYNQGDNHYGWKGGVKTRPDGYLRDSKTDRYIHRIVMEKHLNRKLLSEEHIHHIDGNNQNNEVCNLIVVSNSEHRKIENAYAKRNEKGQYSK